MTPLWTLEKSFSPYYTVEFTYSQNFPTYSTYWNTAYIRYIRRDYRVLKFRKCFSGQPYKCALLSMLLNTCTNITCIVDHVQALLITYMHWCSILARILPALLITYKHCWSRTCIAAQYLHEYYLHCWSRTSIVDHVQALLITYTHCWSRACIV
jgi:hypothetical protein